MLIPLILIALAVLSVAVVGYGANPYWAQYARGIELIVFTWRFQWLLAGFSLLMCVALIGMVVSGKRRAWWLIGLAPVLVLFVHRISHNPTAGLSVLDSPVLLERDQATFLNDGDYVVGVVFQGKAYAYPFAALYETPVIFQTEHDKRMIVIWSAYANRALAFNIRTELHAREMQIVSMPANALLLYNSRRGQFINGVTGKTTKGDIPSGFSTPLATVKTTWKTWREAHASTRVLAPLSGQTSPALPIEPGMPMPAHRPVDELTRRVVVVAATQPIVVPAEAVTTQPLNIWAGKTPVLLFRKEASGPVLAYNRMIEEDQPATFVLNTDVRLKGYLVDPLETRTGWSVEGHAVDGHYRATGKRLAPIIVEDDVYWGVLKFWLPDIELVEPKPTTRPAASTPPEPQRPPPRRSGGKR